MVPELLISLTVSVPCTSKSFVISTFAFGIKTIPVPLARSSKFVLEVVVVMKLSSINISSNCAAPETSKSCVTVTLPVIVASPVWFKSPVSVNVPFTVVSCRSVVPLTVRLLLICTLLSGINISPVPLARSSKSLLLFVVVIKLSSIRILPLLISPAILKLPVCVVSPVCVIVPVI